MSINLPLYIVRCLLNVPQDGLMAMVLCAFDTGLKDLTPVGAQSHAGPVFILQRVTVFIGNRMETEHQFLGTRHED